jgi:transcriptional regulator with PAS, ATPase and Fis domain
LEDHEIIRVGGTVSKEINVRIIAATNKNIEEMISQKKFREDLYYRLNVVPIYISALKERRDDILPLIHYFLEKFNKDYKKNKSLSPETVETLCKYNFPGNIRELANLIERLVVVSENDQIQITDLPNAVTSFVAKTISYPLISEDIPLKDALERYEISIIERTLKKYGSQREAAKALKVDQGTISRKLKKNPFPKSDVILHK